VSQEPGQPDRPGTAAAIPAGPAAAGLSAAARAAVEAGMPAETRRALRAGVDRYAAWAREHGHGLPATGEALTEYAEHLAYGLGLAPVTIERDRWAVLTWHRLAGHPAPPTDGLVAVLRGYRAHLARTRSARAAPRRATPATPPALRAMLAGTDRGTPAGRRDAAILLLGFAIAARRGELAGLNAADVTVTERGMQVLVWREKTRKMDDPVVLYRADAAVCPVRAIRAWLADLDAAGRAGGPLFVRVDRHGRLAAPATRGGRAIGDPAGRMTGQAIGQVIGRRAAAAGLAGTWTGHSVRRGLATSAHEAGATRRAIERQGGWSAGSRAVAGYIEDADRWLVDVLAGVL
jgi:integrase